ncbi:acyltransferase [Glutamicibacter uratoxydans]|uniref:Acyltransferase n=1 Tax=Glutamicibacter uratoxydans TaxID=43667 RepID=A0A4Y4DP91_GLUUR|nr:acyltransferase [Glutamicibacter uratoxydans]GED07142.1 acyltransferase [Glutamicibacter uratoxydans]
MSKREILVNKSARPRLGLLDGLRIMAALLVVLYHYTAWGHSYWGAYAPDVWPLLSAVTRYGQLGVQLFFLISGFVILMSLQGRNVAHFIGSRVGRLYPAYWLAVIAAAILCFVLWPRIGEGRAPSDIIPNLTMMQGAFNIEDLDGVYWTLWVELRFYILLGVMLALGLAKDRYIMALSVLWPSAGFLLHFTELTELQDWIAGQYAALFSAGMVIYLIYKQGHSMIRWLLVGFNTVIAAYFTGIKGSSDALSLSNMQVPAWHYQLLVVLCVGLLALFTLTPLNKVETKWLMVAGSLTFPLYLFHEIWGWWIINQLHPWVNKYVLLIGTIVLMLAWAYVVARYVEKPVGLKLRNATTNALTAAAGWFSKRRGQVGTPIAGPKYQQ